jgi:NAD(P)-dependent dehydrogenase (short-subunit alcohol dehydrogenase family)
MAVLERCWESVIEVADTLIAAPVPAAKIVFIAPRPGAGELAGAARAALENLARSLSVEWARHPVTACAVWPGAATSAGELSELVCFLLSPAGDYFSGCRFELGGLGAAEA